MQASLERALAELIRGPAIERAEGPAFEAWLSRAEFDAETARAVTRDFERLLVYRRLVRRTLRSAIELAMPRAVARLGASFDRYFDGFLELRGPRSHYLRDVTTEFLDFCEQDLRRDASVPPFLMDLARHEALSIEIGATVERRGATFGELDLERGLVFVEAARVGRYEFAVHKLADDLDDRSEPPREPTSLLVYRSPDHDVRYLELSPLAADMLDELLAGRTLRAAVLSATARRGVEASASVLEGTARLLSDLAERGALLGARLDAKSAPDAANAELKDAT